MLGAIGRLIRAIWYAITFQFDKLAKNWSANPAVIHATYDHIAGDQMKRIQATKKAVAGQLQFKLRQEARLRKIAAEIAEQEEGMRGAMAMAQQRVVALKAQGKNLEEIKNDPEYIRCQKGYEDLSSTLNAKREEVKAIEIELQGVEKDLAESEAGLESALRELDSIQGERHDTVAKIQLAQQRRELADLKAGLSTTGASEERRRMQELRDSLTAEATVSEKLAGIDSTKATKQFQEYARRSAASSEFDQLLGLADAPAPVAIPAAPVQEKLPET